ncbi:uncharacterized protein UBRO2_04986 [Ustilago bromivora]|nr:uncharacterized protein UBRO2_04986 [Ustilago bromivora]
MDGEDMQRLWSLIEDLTNQLQANRQLCESLQQQADQLRGQAIHSGTGFALRRFNTDLSKEKFESELEALNAHLVKENLSLSHENKQQAVLLREYENTLETVMAKFRSFSHSTQQHTLQLTQHYESLLAQTTHNAAEQTLAAETAFSGTLTHLGGMVRRALQSLDGEVSDDDEEEEEEGEGDGSGSGRKRKSKRGWVQDPKWYGSGGYTGKMTDPVALRADEALEQLTEEERLRMENNTLRELLGLKEKSDALLSAGRAGGLVQANVNAAAAAPKPMSPAERRASLTVDEAAIAAEASGQPPYKALSISSTTRPGEESSVESATSPARASPKFTSALERKDQIIEEAISAEDENNAGRGRQAGETSLIVEAAADGEASTNTAALPFVFAADDAEEAPSSIEELRASAAAKQENGETTQVHATLPDTTGAATDADEITPIDEVDVPSLAEPASSAEPNLLAEASPPALVSTGIEDSDAKTTVTSASGIDVAESTGAAPSPTQTRSAASTASSSSSSSPSLSAGTSETSISVVETEAKEEAEAAAAPPADSAEGDFAPVVSEPSAAAAETKEAVLPAEPAKAGNASVSPEAVVLADAKGTTTPVSSTEGKEKAGAAAAPVKETRAPSTPNQGGGGKKDGQASPAKKGGRGHRGKGNRHNKSNSSASNKSGF